MALRLWKILVIYWCFLHGGFRAWCGGILGSDLPHVCYAALHYTAGWNAGLGIVSYSCYREYSALCLLYRDRCPGLLFWARLSSLSAVFLTRRCAVCCTDMRHRCIWCNASDLFSLQHGCTVGRSSWAPYLCGKSQFLRRAVSPFEEKALPSCLFFKTSCSCWGRWRLTCSRRCLPCLRNHCLYKVTQSPQTCAVRLPRLLCLGVLACWATTAVERV